VLVEGTYTLPGRREAVWPILLDPAAIARTMPGAKGMVRTAPDRYAGKMRVVVGMLLAAEFDLSITLVDVVEPERYTMVVDGRGRLGTTRGRATVRLGADGEGGSRTRMLFRADLEVGGAITVVGQRLLDSVARRLTRQGLEALAREVGERLGRG
jgi:carbon monoxide dehydrogenase subunit G